MGLSLESEHDMMWASVGCWNQGTLAAWLVFSAAELGRGLYRKRYVLCVRGLHREHEIDILFCLSDLFELMDVLISRLIMDKSKTVSQEEICHAV